MRHAKATDSRARRIPELIVTSLARYNPPFAKRFPETSQPNESNSLHRTAAHGLQCIHDIRLVWTFEKPGHETANCGRASELGDRVLRISAAGAREPHRVRQANIAAAQDAAGSYHAQRVRAVQRVLHAAVDPRRFSLGGAVHVRRGVLYVPWHSNGRLREQETRLTAIRK